MKLRSGPTFKPFASRGRGAMVAIIATFALLSVVSVVLQVRSTSHSKDRASVVEVAARQRTLAERYVNEVLLAREGSRIDPSTTASVLNQSARALLEGGEAPGVVGDEGPTTLPAANGLVRSQIRHERRLAHDLTAAGAALLAGRPVRSVPPTADVDIMARNRVERLRILAALTSNVSLNAAGTIAREADENINDLIATQIAIGAAGLAVAILFGVGLVAATRRQTAHFRSLVTASTDLVMVFGAGGCRYASRSVTTMLGRSERDLLGEAVLAFVHPDDLATVREAFTTGSPRELDFRLRNRFGEWRSLEARVTDLRSDRDVRGVVLNARDVTERKQLQDELTRRAFHDGVTGLPNRALFRDRLDQAIARSTRSSNGLAVLMLDLDGFKQVNDSLGHDAGDLLLQRVAARIDEVTRPGDTQARFGGDEFALLMDGADRQQAEALVQRLLSGLAKPMRVSGQELAVSASAGIAIHSGGTGNTDELLRNAELAMYAAKDRGRGHIEVFDYDMSREFVALLGLEHDLRSALHRGEFSVHYQPEVSLENGAIVGVEALARWESAARGMVPPDQFIPVAEATDLIFELGEFVLQEACAQTALWRQRGELPEHFVTWVNVSAKQLSAGGVIDLVQRTLNATGLPPASLGLEVTETAMVEGAGGERAKIELEQLHALGVGIAIDDFGTGFSSLGQLRQLPIDMLKVDRSFVQGIEHDSKDAAITASVVNLAHALGVPALAEGIESSGQLQAVRTVGCELAQGYLFARPAPADQVTGLLAVSRNGPAAREPAATPR